MQERAEELYATLTIHSDPVGGTAVQVTCVRFMPQRNRLTSVAPLRVVLFDRTAA